MAESINIKQELEKYVMPNTTPKGKEVYYALVDGKWFKGRVYESSEELTKDLKESYRDLVEKLWDMNLEYFGFERITRDEIWDNIFTRIEYKSALCFI